MTAEQLIANICEAQDSVRSSLLLWVSTSPAFQAFAEKYRDKIRAKVRGCRADHELGDLLWELEVAHLLVKKPEFQIEYEPYGTDQCRSPDYRVSTLTRYSFNVEATRIREASPETRFEIWEREIKKAVRAVPSQVGVSVNVPAMNPPLGLLDQLEAQCDRIKTAIAKLIVEADAHLQLGETRRLPVPGFNGLIDVEITKPEHKANPGCTSYYGGSFPIWFTQREFRKFGDVVCAKIGQCRSGMANLLAVGSRSVTHDELDCKDAIGELGRLAVKEDDDFFRAKGFEGAAAFRDRYRNLSAIVFRSSWTGDADRNFVWVNPQAANRLDDGVVGFLHVMD